MKRISPDTTKQAVQALAIIATIFALDQICKTLAQGYLAPSGSVDILGDILRFTYIENRGIAFGITIGNRFVFNSLSILAVLFLLVYMIKLSHVPRLRLAFAAILGGAAGNLTDRLSQGRVIDFFDLDFPDVVFPGIRLFNLDLAGFTLERWPVFNVADIAVFFGMLAIFSWVLSDFYPSNSLSNVRNEKA
ncbi:MAG TPA: signal peptidase II [Calditrichia bacterium]|nr:signal peptidase II [Calditrichota bacterium]HQU72107.1 signal peptidase II [Calditrichia bacterium]HQV31500.1 signal peptidase II [Calditrichia bacterium]